MQEKPSSSSSLCCLVRNRLLCQLLEAQEPVMNASQKFYPNEYCSSHEYKVEELHMSETCRFPKNDKKKLATRMYIKVGQTWNKEWINSGTTQKNLPLSRCNSCNGLGPCSSNGLVTGIHFSFLFYIFSKSETLLRVSVLAIPISGLLGLSRPNQPEIGIARTKL